MLSNKLALRASHVLHRVDERVRLQCRYLRSRKLLGSACLCLLGGSHAPHMVVVPPLFAAQTVPLAWPMCAVNDSAERLPGPAARP